MADFFRCPIGKALRYSTTDRQDYREYKSRPSAWRVCPLLDQCARSHNHQKVVVRHMREEERDQINQNRLTDWGKRVYERRRETVERSFADAKQLHRHRYARYGACHG